MSLTADVVVIGGGVNGASTAWHLAKQGAKVTLLERTSLAAGATGKSGALVRMHYSNAHDASLAWQSLPYFQSWSEVVGPGDPAYRQTGMARIVPPRFEENLRANVEMLRELGINTSVISADELREIDPTLQTGDFSVAAWEPESGYADPAATAYSFVTAAKELGASIHEGVEALAIETEHDQVTGVRTTLGSISTRTVVAAPGGWSNRLLQPLGLDYGLQPNRVQIAIFRRPAGDTVSHPVFIDGLNNTWIRSEGEFGILCGVNRDQFGVDPDFYNEGVDFDYIADARKRCAARMPALAGATMRGGWAGIITMSPDGHAIIDELAPYTGLFGILGDSGTNFKTAPAIGKCVAEWITTGAATSVDLKPFRASRFAEGALFSGDHEYGDSLLDVFR